MLICVTFVKPRGVPNERDARLEGGQRDEDLIVRVAGGRDALALHHTDDGEAERDAELAADAREDADGAADRIGVAEQVVGDLRAEHDDERLLVRGRPRERKRPFVDVEVAHELIRRLGAHEDRRGVDAAIDGLHLDERAGAACRGLGRCRIDAGDVGGANRLLVLVEERRSGRCRGRRRCRRARVGEYGLHEHEVAAEPLDAARYALLALRRRPRSAR